MINKYFAFLIEYSVINCSQAYWRLVLRATDYRCKEVQDLAVTKLSLESEERNQISIIPGMEARGVVTLSHCIHVSA